MDHQYLVSSDRMKIENNKNNVFSKIEIADNEDEQIKAGKEIIKDNEDVIKKIIRTRFLFQNRMCTRTNGILYTRSL